MLILPWDGALDTDEWRHWLATTDRFGVLAVNNLDPAQAPLLPAHRDRQGSATIGESAAHVGRVA